MVFGLKCLVKICYILKYFNYAVKKCPYNSLQSVFVPKIILQLFAANINKRYYLHAFNLSHDKKSIPITFKLNVFTGCKSAKARYHILLH